MIADSAVLCEYIARSVCTNAVYSVKQIKCRVDDCCQCNEYAVQCKCIVRVYSAEQIKCRSSAEWMIADSEILCKYMLCRTNSLQQIKCRVDDC